MPASDAKGSVLQGYNCQAAVDARAQIVVAADITDEPMTSSRRSHADSGAGHERTGASDREHGHGLFQ